MANTTAIVALASLMLGTGAALAQNNQGVTLRSRDLDNDREGAGRFVLGDIPMTATPNTVSGAGAGALSATAGGATHTTSSSWWYRLAGDTRESALSSPSARSYFNIIPEQIDYQFFPVRAQSTILMGTTYRMTERPNTSGYGWRVRESVSITNAGTAPVTLQLFNYLDPSMAGTQGNDAATLINGDPNAGNALQMNFSEGSWTLRYKSFDATSFIAGARDNGGFGLTDNAVTDWANTGFPLAAGDVAGGYEFNITLAAGETKTVSASLELVPTPGAGLLLGSGSLLCVMRRRRGK